MPTSRYLLSWGVAAGLVALTAAAPPSYAGSVAADGAHIIFHINVDRITESSSLAVSTAHPGLVYTTNDSGDGPYVYVLNHSGELVGTTTLKGVTPVDIEAISAGKDGSLIVADIGDNNGKRSSVPVYKIPQPATGDHTVTPEKVSLTYADGPRNAESVVYDTTSGRLIVVSKLLVGGRIYETPPNVFSQPTATLTSVADAPAGGMSTDASLLPGHAAIVVRTYRDAVIYHYPGFTYWQDLDLPTQQMGESIAWVPGGKAVWVGSEGVDSPVWTVPLPVLAGHPGKDPPNAGQAGAPRERPETRQESVTAVRRDDQSSVMRLSTSAGALVVVVGAVVLLSRYKRAR
jgi:hypothetical protein